MLYVDLDLYGDNTEDFLTRYRKKCNIDLSRFMEADYFKEEGFDGVGDLMRFVSIKKTR